MPQEPKEKVEKVSFQGYSLERLVNKEFLDKVKDIKGINGDINPVALVLTKTNIQEPLNKEDKKILSPAIIILSHESDKDVKDKILHISSSDSELMDKIKEIIKNI